MSRRGEPQPRAVVEQPPPAALLSVRDLVVGFGGAVAIDGVSFDVGAGEAVGIVGSSGAGKTVTALSLTGLLPREGRRLQGSVHWKGHDLATASHEHLRRVRGREIGMVFQEVSGALHPVLPVVDQVAEALTAHEPKLRRGTARERAFALLEDVGIAADDNPGARYPHQWSGGMRQRALIAMAVAAAPDLIIADEPTTALDVVTQARVLEVLRRARERSASALLLISHDLDVIAQMVDRVIVMHDGGIVEEGSIEQVLRSPRAAPTRTLVESRLRSAARHADRTPRQRPQSTGRPRLRADDLVVRYRRGRRSFLTAVDGLSLTLAAGETLGLVGESGCGKTSLARTLVGLKSPTRGRVLLHDLDLATARGAQLRRARQRIQIVFQDPRGSLNPRRRVGDIIGEPLRVHGRAAEVPSRVPELLERVGLAISDARRRPHEFSGGQRQRIAIARALSVGPEVLVLDEPVSALDTATRARIMDLLESLRRDFDLSMLLIAHDLTLVRDVADRIAVMQRGRLVETGAAEKVYERPQHPYTRTLLDARPSWYSARKLR